LQTLGGGRPAPGEFVRGAGRPDPPRGRVTNRRCGVPGRRHWSGGLAVSAAFAIAKLIG